ncbi:glycoprotein [Pseudomonas sp. S 311-6]|nr:glycoprotein [Bordetella sp. J329]MCO7643262.1 glycoprotein [Pseudomonas sp. S 311-6]
MAKYEVIRPWHGVKAGQIVELAKLHPALKSNVRPLRGEAAELVPATPEAGTTKRVRPPKETEATE